MMKDSFAKLNQAEVVYEDRSRNKCVIRKRDLDHTNGQQQISLEMSIKGILPKQFVYLLDRITET
jgi:hypothetical protein